MLNIKKTSQVALFPQRTITGSSKGQRVNGEVIYQSDLDNYNFFSFSKLDYN